MAGTVSSAMVKLIILDIDGTLVPDGHNAVPAENIAAIAEVRRAGVQVALATARKFRPAQHIAGQLDLQLPIICHGGAYISLPDGAVIFHTPLDMEVAREITTYADKAGHRLIVTVDEWNYLARYYLPLSDAPFEDLRIVPSNTAALTTTPTRIATVDEAASNDLYQRYCGDPRVQLARFYRGATLYCLAFFNPGVNKGQAVCTLCNHIGIETHDVLAMGDMETDISMFRIAGQSIAMSHSPAEVKAAADQVAPDGEPAVAWALNKLLQDRLVIR
ncbi:MAG: HAD-IIB family hydrolase [Armatimonadota bacterium]